MAKILQLCAVDFTAYHLLRPLGLALRDSGHEVTFCCSPGEGLDALAREGFGTAAIPVSRSYNLLSHFVSFVRLLGFLRRNRFDAVHAHTPVAGLIGRLAARLAGVPVVIYTAHGFYFHEGMRGPLRRAFIALERFGARLSDLVFVQSGEDRDEAVRERVAQPEKLVHIGNGIDPALFDRARCVTEAAAVREELGLGDAPVVGFVGRIVREKGAVEFVRAAAAVRVSSPGVKFVMVGAPLASDRDGCRAEIERLRGGLGLAADLVMTGYRKDIPALLAAFDIFVLPSYREGMPRALLEAMAASLPVVATDIRGCREEVEDGVTGRLVPPRDHEALARVVAELLAAPDAARAMGEAGRARVEEHFDERDVLAVQVRHIDRLVGA